MQMQMQIQTAARIIEFFREYNAHFKSLSIFVAKKQEKVVADDLVWLSDAIAEEQKLVMRGNSLESRRLLLFEELGLKDYKSSQLIDEMPDEFKGELRLLIDFMEKCINYIQEVNHGILDLVEQKLDVQAQLLNQNALVGSNTYTAKGEKIHKSIAIPDDDFLGKV
ncbi:MAG: flagellar protein FlgN [Oscillospiraceae bacterium]|nr:flagellar protein FlgN [Oscillospiraceae bacterium]